MKNNKTRPKSTKRKTVKQKPQVLLANDGHVSDLTPLDEDTRSKEFLAEYYGN